MASWATIPILHLQSVILVQGVHESVISLISKSSGNYSTISSFGFSTLELGGESWDLGVKLSKSPVIVKMTREIGVRVGILWHWASNVWLWIFIS